MLEIPACLNAAALARQAKHLITATRTIAATL